MILKQQGGGGFIPNPNQQTKSNPFAPPTTNQGDFTAQPIGTAPSSTVQRFQPGPDTTSQGGGGPPALQAILGNFPGTLGNLGIPKADGSGARRNALQSAWLGIDPSQQQEFRDRFPNFQPGAAGGGGGGRGGGGVGGIFGGLGDTTVFDRVLEKYNANFDQRARDYTEDAMANAGFLGNRYGTYGMREAATQGERAALESQAMFQPLLMQNLNNNLGLANLKFDVSAFDQTFGASQNAQQFDQIMRLFGLGQPPGGFGSFNSPSQPGAVDFMKFWLDANR